MASESQLKQFDEDGFLILEDFLSPEDVEALKKECWELVDSMNPEEHSTTFSTVNPAHHKDDYFITSGDKIRYFFEDGVLDKDGKLLVDKHASLNKIGHALHALSPNFRRVTYSEKMVNLAKSLGLEDPCVCQSMYIFKQPGIGGKVIPHQDASFLHTEPLSLTGIWIALEDATIDNGCLWFIPGSHKDGVINNHRLVRNPEPTGPSTIFVNPKPEYDTTKFVPGPVKKGSLVVIHGLIVHKSEQNTSDKSRQIYTFHLFDQKKSTYSPQNWLQPTPELPFPSMNTFPPA